MLQSPGLLPATDGVLRHAAEIALDCRRRLVRELKPDGSMVTNADREVEAYCRRALTEALPGSTVWGEEEGFEEPGPNGLWLVDPIDGTTNFAFGQPLWGITIALWREGALQVGAVCLPDLDRWFLAERGRGATCNGLPLAPVSPNPIRQEELIGLADDSPGPFRGLGGKSRHVGAFVVEAMFVALGYYRAMTATRCKLYDAAGSLVILRELGARVVTATGEGFDDGRYVRPVLCEPFAVVPQGALPLQRPADL